MRSAASSRVDQQVALIPEACELALLGLHKRHQFSRSIALKFFTVQGRYRAGRDGRAISIDASSGDELVDIIELLIVPAVDDEAADPC